MVSDPRHLKISDFTYTLPDDKIARYPLPVRDASKLLVCSGSIIDHTYAHLDQHIPAGSLMVFNQSKVLQARLLFKKDTGSTIEVFCLEPAGMYPDVATAMLQTRSVRWKCLVGGAGKWKNLPLQLVHHNPSFTLLATREERLPDGYLIELSWNCDLSFAEILHYAGNVPLPPYLNRAVEVADKSRYQTVYAAEEGSVAAPTAGLHFTQGLMRRLTNKDIDTGFVTLHVGAGTFMPVKSQTMAGHHMHSEWAEVTRPAILQLMSHLDKGIIAVGTTSLRTLESLYRVGCNLPGMLNAGEIAVSQWEGYDTSDVSPRQALRNILDRMDHTRRDTLVFRTEILIAPGYRFRIVKGLVTNFHQPGSTLLLLVAAFIGPRWRAVYDHALAHGYRFLSYGDGCLLWNNDNVNF